MSSRAFIILMTFATALCFVTWGFVVTNNDPGNGGLLALIFFYSSLALATTGLFSVLGFAIRKAVIKNDSALLRHIPAVFRQSIFFALGVVIALILASYRVLTWWNAALLGIIILIIEIIIFTNRRFRNTDYVQ